MTDGKEDTKIRSGLFKRRNSLPEVIVRRPKIIQVKSLDIPINVTTTTSNTIQIQPSHVPDFLPPCLTATSASTSYHKDTSSSSNYDAFKPNNKFLENNYKVNLKSFENTTCLDDINPSASDLSETFICKNCKNQNKNTKLVCTSDEDGYQKIMPMISAEMNMPISRDICSPLLIPLNKKQSTISPIESDNGNKDTRALTEFHRNNNDSLKIFNYDERTSSSFEALESREMHTEDYVESDTDLAASQILIQSFRELSTNSEVDWKKCKTQFLGSEKNSTESSNGDGYSSHGMKNEKKQNVITNDEKQSEEIAKLFLNADVLKKFNVDFVFLNFGTVYPAKIRASTPLIRDLNKMKRTDSIEVQCSSTTNESSSCSASDSSNNNNEGKMIAIEESTCKPPENVQISVPERTITMNAIIPTRNTNQKDLTKSKVAKKINITHHKHLHHGHLHLSHHSSTRTASNLKKTPTLKEKPQTQSSSKHKELKSAPKNRQIKKMTIFQTQSADTITPDKENGPKRFYQKTEIDDGDKHIEILEIVECADNSRSSTAAEKMILDPLSSKQMMLKNSSKSSITNQNSKENLKTIKFDNSNENLTQKSNSKVHFSPKLNHSNTKTYKTESTQTVPNSFSSCILCKHQEKLPKQLTDEFISTINIRSPNRKRGTPRKSCDSFRNRPIFDAIPEEKSSLSTDSSGEECKKIMSSIDKDGSAAEKVLNKNSVNISPNFNEPLDSQYLCKCKIWTPETVIEKKSSTAVLPRIHSQQSIDDEYTITQSEGSIQHTITTPSTVTANVGSVTPKCVSAANFPTSSESDNAPNPNISVMNTLKLSPKEKTPKISSSETSRSNSTKNQTICENTKSNQQTEVSNNSQDHLTEKSYQNIKQKEYVWRVDASDDYKTTSALACANILNTGSTTISNITEISNQSTCFEGYESQCSRCCFCNPILHESSDSTDTLNCVYCNRKKTPKLEEAETNTECDLVCSRNCLFSCIYCESCLTKAKKNLRKPTTTTNVNAIKNESIAGQANLRLECPTRKQNKDSSRKVTQKLKQSNSSEQKYRNSDDSGDVSTLYMVSSESETTSLVLSKNSSSSERRKVRQQQRNVEIQESPNFKNISSETKTNSSVQKTQQQSPGWSVTVSGTCQDLVPDVEMKLKFLKSLSEDANEKSSKQSAIPKANSVTIDNSARNIDHLALPSMKQSIGETTDTYRSQSDCSYQFPEATSSSRRQLIPTFNMKSPNKKSKHDYIAASATGVMSAKDSNGKNRRTMSYHHHVISTQSRIIQEHNCPLKSSASKSNYRQQRTRNLAVTGNAIEPERKPNVPTMSEKDLTRKNRDINFTRNRPFYV